jgi:hypothetical protein
VSSPTPTKKDQHTIPQLHLRNFAGNDPAGHIWTFHKASGKTTSAVPKEVGFEKHFYSVVLPDGTKDTSIEDFLCDVEGKAAPVYHDLLKDQLPADGLSRSRFSEFLAAMYFRTTIMRERYAEGLSQFLQAQSYAYAQNDPAFESLLRRVAEDTGVELTDEQKTQLRADMIDPSGYQFEIHKERTLAALKGVETLAPILFAMKWSILQPARGGFFITSDNPLVRDVSPASISPIYGDGGFKNKTAQVIFPLSPQRMLFMCWDKTMADVGTIPRNAIERFNEGIAARAHRFLYAHIHHRKILKLAQIYKDSRPTYKMSGFVPNRFGVTKVVRSPKAK